MVKTKRVAKGGGVTVNICNLSSRYVNKIPSLDMLSAALVTGNFKIFIALQPEMFTILASLLLTLQLIIYVLK
jgi:hypothetical protein